MHRARAHSERTLSGGRDNMSDQPAADITAEWTVHAQLTIVRGGSEAKQRHSENVSFESHTTNGADADGDNGPAPGTGGQPVRMVYKWSSDDLKATGCQRQRSCCAPVSVRNGLCPVYPFIYRANLDRFGQKNSVHAVGGGGRNRAASSEPTCRPQCRSTCNIVLTACTDLYPTLVRNGCADGGADGEPVPTYNTTATCTMLPTMSHEPVRIRHIRHNIWHHDETFYFPRHSPLATRPPNSSRSKMPAARPAIPNQRRTTARPGNRIISNSSIAHDRAGRTTIGERPPMR